MWKNLDEMERQNRLSGAKNSRICGYGISVKDSNETKAHPHPGPEVKVKGKLRLPEASGAIPASRMGVSRCENLAHVFGVDGEMVVLVEEEVGAVGSSQSVC